MEHMGEQKFSSPEEEIVFLRKEIARKEQETLERNKEMDTVDQETVGREVIREYGEHEPTQVLDKKHLIEEHDLHSAARGVETATHKIEEIMAVAHDKGIRNALSVLEKANDPFLADEVHRHMVELLRVESSVADLDEKMPLWKVLNMTLFEVALPRHVDVSDEESLQEIFSGMEQFYAGMQTITAGKKPLHYTLEVAVADKRDDIIFYVAVPNEFVNLFEKQALSLFPNAELILQQNDYNIFVEGGVSQVSTLVGQEHPIYPIKTHDEFEKDPLAVLLNAFSKIERDGGGASIQVVISGGVEKYHHSYERVIERIEKGEDAKGAIRKSTLSGYLFEEMKDFVTSAKEEEAAHEQTIESDKIELFNKKISTPVVATNIRLVVSAKDAARSNQILTELESTFHQFQNTAGNKLVPKRLNGNAKMQALKAFSFREFNTSKALPLSLTELATIIHFPGEGLESSPQFKQSKAQHAPAPIDLPAHGTLLGVNKHRNIEKEIYLTPEDRLRHMYVIGQTGVGKTVLLKNMIIQDIEEGGGVCYIDPHGSDIMDVLSAVPPSRREQP